MRHGFYADANNQLFDEGLSTGMHPPIAMATSSALITDSTPAMPGGERDDLTFQDRQGTGCFSLTKRASSAGQCQVKRTATSLH